VRQRDLDYQVVSTMFKEEAPRVPISSINLIREEQLKKVEVTQEETPFTSFSAGPKERATPKEHPPTPRRLEPLKSSTTEFI